ncbi:hypothetical protein HDE_04651 [Halotydeus destructor]|nr:hypothetical protein HDE_04651 [Halotydeus destructor]
MKLSTSLLICALCLITSEVSANPVKRSANECSRTAPCGWQVYKPFERTIDYNVRSPCTCPADTKCVKTSDDVSISAYVYRCRNESEAGSLEEFTNDSMR